MFSNLFLSVYLFLVYLKYYFFPRHSRFPPGVFPVRKYLTASQVHTNFQVQLTRLFAGSSFVQKRAFSITRKYLTASRVNTYFHAQLTRVYQAMHGAMPRHARFFTWPCSLARLHQTTHGAMPRHARCSTCRPSRVRIKLCTALCQGTRRFSTWPSLLARLHQAMHGTMPRHAPFFHLACWHQAMHRHLTILLRFFRLETGICGAIVRPYHDATRSSKITIITQVRGSVPSPLKSTYLTGNPSKWLVWLKKHHNSQVKNTMDDDNDDASVSSKKDKWD